MKQLQFIMNCCLAYFCNRHYCTDPNDLNLTHFFGICFYHHAATIIQIYDRSCSRKSYVCLQVFIYEKQSRQNCCINYSCMVKKVICDINYFTKNRLLLTLNTFYRSIETIINLYIVEYLRPLFNYRTVSHCLIRIKQR